MQANFKACSVIRGLLFQEFITYFTFLKCLYININCAVSQENLSSGFPTMFNTNQAVQPQKIVRGLKFQIYKDERIYYQRRENKDADQMAR